MREYINQCEIRKISALIAKYKFSGELIIPEIDRHEFMHDFHFITGIKISLDILMFSELEVIFIALSTIYNNSCIAQALGVELNYVRNVEKRLNRKLGTEKKIQSVCIGVQTGCISIYHSFFEKNSSNVPTGRFN